MKTVKIGKRLVGDSQPCFIIAEAGSNHNGKLALAFKLIDVAADAGADAVKFQIFKADKLYVGKAGSADYLKAGKSIYEIIKEMEMPLPWVAKIAAHCRKKGVVFMCSAFDDDLLDIIDKYAPVHKIASYESGHLPFIRKVARKGKPAIMSTGASPLDEVRESVKVFLSTGNKKLMLMQCTAKYPAPASAMNLRAIAEMKKEFGVPVGLSDHSTDAYVSPVASVALGANLIEKHFTLSRKMKGPDHKFALEPNELAAMVSSIRQAEASLGDGKKKVEPEELELFLFAKRAVHAIKKIRKGEKFTSKNVAVLRPGKIKRGLHPRFYEIMLGKKAKRAISQWQGIQKGDF
ncbi:MAG: N-acetylneuraminate synthase family protein [Candidatus Micrarchaeota archaeon]|nr:N-acetylneuraminate synthase family protein [Candidatus Micrarchaeota archaeon]